MALWRESVHPRGTPAEHYVNSRALELGDDIAGRCHSLAPQYWGDGRVIPATSPTASHKPSVGPFSTAKRANSSACSWAPVGGAAIMLVQFRPTRFSAACMSARASKPAPAAGQLGLRPCWALGSKGAIGAFPVLSGIEALTILAEPDAETEIQNCVARWHAAGREVKIIRPVIGKDLNGA